MEVQRDTIKSKEDLKDLSAAVHVQLTFSTKSVIRGHSQVKQFVDWLSLDEWQERSRFEATFMSKGQESIGSMSTLLHLCRSDRHDTRASGAP